MIKKIITFVFVLLMMSPIFMTSQMTNNSTLEFTPEQNSLVAETDLNRVTWEDDVIPNGDFESWTNPQNPADISTTTTTEEATWFETTVVSEGSRAIGMHSRALDPLHESAVRLTQQAWIYWDNPINTTLDFEWYLDEIGNPVDQDYFRMQVRMSGRNMYYYIGCDATVFNTTGTAYFIIDGLTKVWNHLHRNLTADYIAVFGDEPAEFQLIYWWIRTYTDDYTRVYIDDVNLVNSSYVHVGGSTLNGNFEGGGGWTFQGSTDPADISQSPVSHEGSWSMNMTAISYNYSARATAQTTVEKRLSPINQGQLSFYWRIDDWVNSASNTLSYVRVTVANTTTSLTMYYYLCVGGAGNLPPLIFGNDMKFQANGFNVTDTWNHFDRNIWEDFHSMSTTNDLYLQTITIYVGANQDGSRLSVLFDELSFTTSIMNDMSYETQGAVGSNIQGWSEPNGDDAFTVTDFAYTGIKAGNMTLEDDDDFSYNQKLGNIPIDDTTELIFDFNVYFDTFNQTSEDFIFFDFRFGDGETISYVVANSSSEFENWLDEVPNIIYLQEAIVTGQWLNFQLDLVHDYESQVGSLPDTTLNSVYLVALASKSSKIVVYLDDLYVYYDTDPEIGQVYQNPTVVEEAGELVEITAEVVDANTELVRLSYRVDSGDWINLTMTESVNNTFEVEFNAPWRETEYFVTAIDAFGKSDVAMNGTDYFSFHTEDTISPTITLAPANESVVSDIVSIEITVHDLGSGFADGELFIDGTSIANITLESLGISWDTTVISNGMYNITVVASDNAGHTAIVTHFVTVENLGVTIDPIIPIVIVIAIVGGIAVIYIFVLKKR